MILAILACVLLAQASQRPNSPVMDDLDAMRWQMEHATEMQQRQHAAAMQREVQALRDRRACIAIGRSAAMHLTLYLEYSGADTVNLNAHREQQAWRQSDKRFRACEKQLGTQ